MKKFLISSVVLLLCILFGLYAIYFEGFYLDFNPDAPVTTHAKVLNKKIQVQNNHEYQDFVIKGVDLPSSLAGYYSTDYAIQKETYLRWFQQIQEMGANTIRIYTLYNDVFYDAFYEYNQKNINPLYLLQGIQVSDYANNSTNSAYGKDFYYSLRKDAIDAVDVIHGKKVITINKMKGSGFYNKDVSKWTLGYIVGNEWNAETIQYTDKSDYSAQFDGTYFQTTKDATHFEVMLAKVMDSLVSYESSKYKKQSLITFSSSPEIDPFEFEEQYARQIGKYASVDAEHIIPTDHLLSGYFVSYQLYDFCPGFAKYFSKQQQKKLENILSHMNTSLYYDGYTQLLQDYHTMPVVISGFGYSSSRGTDNIKGPLNEVQQGENIVKTYNDIITSGCSGAFIDSWQDCWEKRGWNISYAVDLNENYRWNDIQSDSTGYGLLSFGSQNILIDGNMRDWNEKTVICDDQTMKISTCYDEKGIYLYIEKNGLSRNDELYIPIDVTPNSGSRKVRQTNLSFDRDADFMIHLNGNDSRILVQSRYEALRENYLTQTQGKDPFVEYPKKNDDRFVPISLLTDKKNIVEESMSDQEKFNLRLYSTYETGRLKEGSSNVKADTYDSLTDYAYGKNSVEIRIPWQILNFYNPTDNQIHDDYYAGNYGVKGMDITDIYIGAGSGDEVIKLHKMSLDKKPSLKYQERLKQSYEVVKKSWGGKHD